MVAFRKSVPIDKLISYLDTHEWADPGANVGHLGPAPALFQYAMHDQFIEMSAAKHYFEIVPARMKSGSTTPTML